MIPAETFGKDLPDLVAEWINLNRFTTILQTGVEVGVAPRSHSGSTLDMQITCFAINYLPPGATIGSE